MCVYRRSPHQKNPILEAPGETVQEGSKGSKGDRRDRETEIARIGIDEYHRNEKERENGERSRERGTKGVTGRS